MSDLTHVYVVTDPDRGIVTAVIPRRETGVSTAFDREVYAFFGDMGMEAVIIALTELPGHAPPAPAPTGTLAC